MAPKSPKMSQDGSQERQVGAQEAAKCSQDGDLGSILEALGSIFNDVGGFLVVRLNTKKPPKTDGSRTFLEDVGSRVEAKSEKI